MFFQKICKKNCNLHTYFGDNDMYILTVLECIICAYIQNSSKDLKICEFCVTLKIRVAKPSRTDPFGAAERTDHEKTNYGDRLFRLGKIDFLPQAWRDHGNSCLSSGQAFLEKRLGPGGQGSVQRETGKHYSVG